MSFNRKFLLTALGLTLAAVAPQASADEIANQFDVTIQIVDSCAISSRGLAPLDFGMHGFSAKNVDSTTNLNVACTKGSSYSIALNAGENAETANDVGTRRMKGVDTLNANDYVAYNLY